MDHAELKAPPFWRSPGGIGLLVVVLVGGFLLYTEHGAHVLGIAPYLLLLACPLTHFFMHGKHDHGGHGHRSQPEDGSGGRDDRPLQ